MKIIEIYDLESLANLFTYTGYDYKNDKWYKFVICPWRNDIDLLYDHCMNDIGLMVGFNNEAYDYPLLHHILRHYHEYKDNPRAGELIYEKSQQLIKMDFSAIADKNKIIPQIDLYKIWHFDNNARRTSLKDLEVQMRMKNIEEMPLHYTHICVPGEEYLILEYNENDVLATYLFLKVTLGKTDFPLYSGKNKIELRIKLKKKFGINCINYPDVKIGEQLMLKLYGDFTNQTIWQIKQLGGSPRKEIHLKDCIPPWANFKTKEFNTIKKKFEETTITTIKGSFDESVIFHGCKMDYGTGGLHSCIKPGVYNADDYWMILDEDVGSLYPSLAIQLGIYPEHLGKVFSKIYDEDIVSVRLSEKKKEKKLRDMVIMEGYKLAANGIYGKSGEETSPLYDPLYTMKTTIGGQMFISLWTEKLVEAIPEIKFIQHNTDGVTYLLPRKDLAKAKAVGEEMTRLTGLYIEDNVYTKFVVRDVNNYLAVYENGDCKCKGCFEIDKEFHKDPSMRIVPIALKEYFINGVPFEKTIKEHKDIFDFCLRLKTNSSCTPVYTYITEGDIVNIPLARTTRYYISNTGGTLKKVFDDGRESGVNVGYVATLFNRFVEQDNYNINYAFYIREAYKIKDAIVDNQLSLFD